MKIENKIFNVSVAIIGIIVSFIPMTLYSSVMDSDAFLDNYFYIFNSVAASLLFSFLMLMVAVFTYVILSSFRSNKIKQYNILNIIPQSIIIYSLAGKVSFANRFACDKFGLTLEEAMGDNILNYLTERDRGRALTDIKEHVTGKYEGHGSEYGVAINDYTAVTKAGKELLSTMYVGTFNLTHLLCIIVDHEELEEARQTYAEQAEFFWGLLNNITIPFSYNDIDGDYKFANTAYHSLIGKDESDISGKNLSEILSKKDYEEANKRRQYVMDSRENLNFEAVMDFDGQKKVVQVDMIPRINKNKVSGTFHTITDITEKRKKDTLLKKEIHLNKTLNKISELLSNVETETIDGLIDQSLLLVRKTFNLCRAYMLSYENNELVVSDENIETGAKPYQGLNLDMPQKHKDFYEKFMSKQGVIKADNISLSKYAPIEHFKLFKAKSMIEVSIPVSSLSEKNAVIGACSVMKPKHWTDSEVEFLSAVGRFIMSAVDRLNKIEDLRLSEETLNTLIDNTDIGIIISDTSGKVFYQNDKFTELFGELEEPSHLSVISRFVAKSDRESALKIFKEREYKGYSGGTILATHQDGHDFYTKIYSSRIDYERSKAYLTTVVDVTEYMVEDIEPIE